MHSNMRWTVSNPAQKEQKQGYAAAAAASAGQSFL